jgi:hypothetical protein
MTHDTSTSKAPPPPAPSAEKKALLDAFDTVLKTQAEERDATEREAETRRRARTSSRPLLAAAAVILLVVGTYLAVAQPSWVFAPRPTPESVATREASLKIAMANAVQHVERFRQRNGRLPESLTEAGARGDGMTFSHLGGSNYRLVGDSGPAHATFTSNESMSDFLGNSFQIILGRLR